MSGTMFIVNFSDRSTPHYYILNPWTDDLSGVLFRISDKITDALKYFSLYRFAFRMGTDSV